MAGEVFLKTLFLDKEIFYDGSQLSSHWILKKASLRGDALVAFIGGAEVAEHLVDLEDSIAGKKIFSSRMLHFIAEHFDPDLERMILRQRLFISLLQQSLIGRTGKPEIVRRGNDLFWKDFKLTVSIATASPVSCLMHTGINIENRGTPVPTKGLSDFDIDPRPFAAEVMRAYEEELNGIRWARCKVRGVS